MSLPSQAFDLNKPTIVLDRSGKRYRCASRVRCFELSGEGVTPVLAWAEWAKEAAQFLFDEAETVKKGHSHGREE